MKRLWIALLAPVLLAGCATMNRSECQNADWHMIGMEDGAKGKEPAYIGNHRRACAKFNVTPNLDEYERGRQEGLTQYCTEAKGLELGERGMAYSGVCPSNLEPQFLAGYNHGQQLNDIYTKINSISAKIDSNKNQLKELKQNLKDKEDQLVHNGTSEGQRAGLLREVKDLQDKVHDLEDEIGQQEEYRHAKKMELEQVR